MHVRVGTVDDITGIVRLKGLIMTTSYPFDVDLDSRPEWPERAAQAIADMMGHDDHRFFVIDAPDGGLAGCISVAITRHVPGPNWGPRHADLGDMCTDGPFRRRGLGRALMDAALDWAREQGAQTARLDATPAAVPVYQRFGFERRDDDLFPSMRRML